MNLTLPLAVRHYHRKQHDDVPLSSAYAVLEVAVAICLSYLYTSCKVAFSLQRGVVGNSVDNLWIVLGNLWITLVLPVDYILQIITIQLHSINNFIV